MWDGTPIIDSIDRIGGQAPSTNGVTDGAQRMVAAAKSGELVFDPATGQSLLNILNHIIDELDTSGRQLSTIAAPTKLGLTEGGLAISVFNHTVAASGRQALKPAHEQFRQTVASVAEAVKIAMDNYARTEQHTTTTFQPSH